jgi:hypothetical protein
MLVYGNLANPLRRALNIPQAAAATVAVTAAMVALSAAKLWWMARRAQKSRQPA